MNKRRSDPSRQAVENPWRKLAAGAGGDGKRPPSTKHANPPNDPSRLTEIFNKAAKPKGRLQTETHKRQVAQLRDQMAAAAKQRRAKRPTRSKTLTSQKAIDAMRRQLSQPKPTLEMTPMGSVARGINPKRDRHLLQEIKRMQSEMKQAKGMAKSAFNRARRSK